MKTKGSSALSAEQSISVKSPEAVTARTGKRRSGSTKRPVTPGTRLGSKRRDMRWQDPEGNVWASRFEYEVYLGVKASGRTVRRTTPEDSMAYTSSIKGGVCTECLSRAVAQEHRYTPDLYVDTSGRIGTEATGNAGYYLEAKGYLRSERRSLLRAFRKARPDCDLRLVVQSDYRVGKGSLTSWAEKYLKVKVHVWNGTLPEGW